MSAPTLSYRSPRRKPALIAICGEVSTRLHRVPIVRHFAIDRAWLDGARLSCPTSDIEHFTPLSFAEAVALRRLPPTTSLVFKARAASDLVMLEVADPLRPVALVDAFSIKDVQSVLDRARAHSSPTIVLGPATWTADLAIDMAPLPDFDTPELRVFHRGELFVLAMAGDLGHGGLWGHDGEVAAWVLAWEIAARLLGMEGRPFEDPDTLRRILRENRLRRIPILARALDGAARHGSLLAAIKYRLRPRRSL